MITMPKTFRNVTIRISALNYATKDNEDPDNIHYHVVISFPKDSVCTFETLKRKFPYGDLEGCKYGVKSCVQYLVHMNHPEKLQYDWSDVVTNSPDKLEDYIIPGKATMNAKLKNILDKIVKGERKEFEDFILRQIEI